MNRNPKPPGLPVLLIHNIDDAWSDLEREEAVRAAGELETAMRDEGHPVTAVAVTDADLAGRLEPFDADELIVFNWCETLPGVPRSEALAAQTLEEMGFTYTGSPPGVLELAGDKRQVKRLLDRRGLPTPHWRLCEIPDPGDWDRYPAIVKPAREHCSMGVTTEAVVMDRRQLEARLARVIEEFRQPALVEDFIDGREFHVTLWGNGRIRVLPPAEMDFEAFAEPCERLCTYDSKFLPGSPHYEKIQLRLPAVLEEEEQRELERTTLAAYRALGCRDYARLDLRLRDGVFYILDVNPNSDISSDTSTAGAAELAGYSYGAMGSRIVSLAAPRHPRLRAGAALVPVAGRG